MRGTVAVLSSGRQDWGILRSTCAALRESSQFELALFVGGMHCSARYGTTRRDVEDDGFEIAEALDWLGPAGELPASEQAGHAVRYVGAALERRRPQALVLAGDRLETAAAALAATVTRTPIVHLHGGEETEGAFDNALRHAITKLGHLHLVSHADHARRVVEMGEAPDTVHVVGAPGLDNVNRSGLPSRSELAGSLGLELTEPLVVVTLHPATWGAEPRVEAEAVVAAMDAIEATYVVTLPNSDPGNDATRSVLLEACESRPRRVAVEALGERRYWALMRCAQAMLGNSSSALIEAPVADLPAVNVGDRQQGRLRGANVIDVPGRARAISAALATALTPSFRDSIRGAGSPYGDGRAAEKILSCLRAWDPPDPPIKRHHSPEPTRG